MYGVRFPTPAPCGDSQLSQDHLEEKHPPLTTVSSTVVGRGPFLVFCPFGLLYNITWF